MPKTRRRDRFAALLPLDTPGGVITGHPPADYMIETPRPGVRRIWDYNACCQDPRNWTPQGEARELAPADPYYLIGFRFYRARLTCRCGVRVNGTEYLRERPAGDGEEKAEAVQVVQNK
jgi:hypothetical protein